ncbi:MAG: DNA-methyltransferase [Fimbriimonadales bacterium]
MKPGGFFFSFSSPRLYHRLTCAVEDSGFLIRDTFLWLYLQNQPKAMSLNHFIDRMPIPRAAKESLKSRLDGWKTPQIRSCYEPIVVAQKPYEGTLLENFLHHGVGLFNTTLRVGVNYYPSNILIVDGVEAVLDKYFLVSKPSKQEKGIHNYHQTVKPVALCEYLILLSTQEGATVLDPFIGSGTTAVAAKRHHRHYIGIDINPEYLDIARARIASEGDEPPEVSIAASQPKLAL